MADADIHPVATGAAARVVSAHQEPQELVFYAAWASIGVWLDIHLPEQFPIAVLPLRSESVDSVRREGSSLSISRSQPV